MNIALQDLFSTDYGLMSLIVIVGVCVIAFVMVRWFRSQIEKDERKQSKT